MYTTTLIKIYIVSYITVPFYQIKARIFFSSMGFESQPIKRLFALKYFDKMSACFKVMLKWIHVDNDTGCLMEKVVFTNQNRLLNINL